MQDNYLKLIDHIVNLTLEGKIRSKTQVYRLLVAEIEPGTGEIFERCLAERRRETESQLEKKVKAARVLRALQTLQGEWERYVKENDTQDAIAGATQRILSADTNKRLLTLLQILDPNQTHVFSAEQVQPLAQSLRQTAAIHPDSELADELQHLATGLTQGLNSFAAIEDYLISWMYEQNRSIGFGEVEQQRGPWALWAKQSPTPLPQNIFAALAKNQSAIDALRNTSAIDLQAWLDLALVLHYIQQGLVTWFDKQPYDTKIGKQLSLSTLLTFAALWSQLANGFQTDPHLAEASFQMTLQIFRTLANREDFPLYGGIFASFGGKYLNDALDYFDEPLGRLEQTPEKARILTLLGYSQQALGRSEQAIAFHEQALEIARMAQEKSCEVASLNHLSRIRVSGKNYTEAINTSQRALIIARQEGDRAGEANALVNLGYSEVLAARQLDRMEPEVYETAIHYLEQGLALAQTLGDRQSQALAYNSLGIAYVVLGQSQDALNCLAEGLEAAQRSGDVYLQGLNYAYLAEAYYSASIIQKSVVNAALGMYLLNQLGASEWRQPAGLLFVVQGKWGEEVLRMALNESRSQIIAAIGVDGYDHIPALLEDYRGTPNGS